MIRLYLLVAILIPSFLVDKKKWSRWIIEVHIRVWHCIWEFNQDANTVIEGQFLLWLQCLWFVSLIYVFCTLFFLFCHFFAVSIPSGSSLRFLDIHSDQYFLSPLSWVGKKTAWTQALAFLLIMISFILNCCSVFVRMKILFCLFALWG